jgi:hypothetical protein
MKTTVVLFALGVVAGCGSNTDGGKPGSGGNGTAGADLGTAPAPGTIADLGTLPNTPADLASAPDLAKPGCQYPSGSYTGKKGELVAPDAKWTCYAPGQSTTSPLTPADLFDCDGSKGINAILLDVSAEWCEPCQGEAQELNGLYLDRWKPLKVVAVTLLAEDINGDPPTADVARRWRDTYKLPDIYVCVGPADRLDVMGYPHNSAIDPRTMKVYDSLEGVDDLMFVDALAKTNAH